MAQQVDALVVVGGYTSGNTRRLAEIVEQTGKPVHHVETEAQLDLESLARANSIGITAGASTPNWITKRIYRALETIPMRQDAGWRGLVFKLQRVLLLTNAYVALGAGCLCFASTKLQGIQPLGVGFFKYVNFFAGRLKFGGLVGTFPAVFFDWIFCGGNLGGRKIVLSEL